VHVGQQTSGPVLYELADAAGLLSTSNVWIGSGLQRWGDIVRTSPGPYPNNGISAEATISRLHGMLHLSETFGTEPSWERYRVAYTDPSNDRDDCACSSTGDAVANCGFNHTSFPGGGLDVLPGTVNGVWEHPLAHSSINQMAGMWGSPHELSARGYDCVIALAAAFAISDQTDGAWDGEEVMANMGRIDDFDGATGTVHLDSSADRVADASHKYSVFNWQLSGAGLASTLVARIGACRRTSCHATTSLYAVCVPAGASGPESLESIESAIFRDGTTNVPPDTCAPLDFLPPSMRPPTHHPPPRTGTSMPCNRVRSVWPRTTSTPSRGAITWRERWYTRGGMVQA
jgi:hypothetical protein